MLLLLLLGHHCSLSFSCGKAAAEAIANRDDIAKPGARGIYRYRISADLQEMMLKRAKVSPQPYKQTLYI